MASRRIAIIRAATKRLIADLATCVEESHTEESADADSTSARSMAVARYVVGVGARESHLTPSQITRAGLSLKPRTKVGARGERRENEPQHSWPDGNLQKLPLVGDPFKPCRGRMSIMG